MAHPTLPSDAPKVAAPVTDLFDITIIGGGPVGLFGAFYAGLRQMKTKIVDSLEELGGQLTTLYPEKYVFDVAGFPQVLARDLAHQCIAQAMQYHPTICLGETVHELTPVNEVPGVEGGGPVLPPCYRITSDKGVHYTRTLLICAGGAPFPRKLQLPDASSFENKGLSYACRSKSLFAGKNVLIAGGGDSAIDWALNLGDVAKSITLIHRSNKFRAHEESMRKLQATPCQIMPFYEIEKIIASPTGHIAGAVMRHSQSKEVQTLAVDAILVQFGFLSSLGPIKDWPLKIEKGSITVNHQMESCLTGIFAAGDVATFPGPGKLKLIATGFGEAAIAVCFAKTRIDSHAKVFPGHSSEMTPQAASVVTV